MADIKPFTGFRPAALDFYRGLAGHNNLAWFEAHRDVFEAEVLGPARSLVKALGEKLRPLVPDLHAEPKINRSLFKIHRDTRFSRDKAPFKTHLGLWLWDGPGPRMEESGFYIQVEPEKLLLAAGVYRFTRSQLQVFRDSVLDPKLGRELIKIVQDLTRAGTLAIGNQHYKRLPPGVEAKGLAADLLKHDGLHAWEEMAPPPELFGPELVEFCSQRLAPMVRLHAWLKDLCHRARAEEGVQVVGGLDLAPVKLDQ